MRRIKAYNARRKRKGKIFFFSFLIILCVAAILMNQTMKPLIRTLATSRAESMATITINDAVTAVMTEQQVEYSDLVTISYNADGLVTSVKINSVAANQLQADLSNSISDRLNQMERKQISIPLGTITGIDFLAGRGPKMKLYINLTGSTSIKLVSDFYTAGINQVCHRIDLDVTANIYIIMAGQSTSTQIHSNINIAETVIVGMIPEIYAGANDDLWPNLVE